MKLAGRPCYHLGQGYRARSDRGVIDVPMDHGPDPARTMRPRPDPELAKQLAACTTARQRARVRTVSRSFALYREVVPIGCLTVPTARVEL